MKELVKCIVSDENYPPIIMHIISNIIFAVYKNGRAKSKIFTHIPFPYELKNKLLRTIFFCK